MGGDGAQIGVVPFLVAVAVGAGVRGGRVARAQDRQGHDGGDEGEDDDRGGHGSNFASGNMLPTVAELTP
ncbi:hypothetical protein [Pseudonocardia zijingensis]|uniref:hypothetical protein n=1 Tax=Pseudonocardia zijingensis TaxID=153376 RepID=UPI0031D8C559